ncbi:hypothetical protein [Chishuiella sp.]|uniref:hypothetical protein n=1 Tax=Chishuiella sp. TaxID=1969467 RepID=UPI0028A7AB0A|nr:hypothetical protein [Chishuiella sp.]
MIHIENCVIMGDINEFISIINHQNNAHYRFDKRDGRISYCDPFGNDMFNCPMKISINFELFKLEQEGDILSFKDGSSKSFLSTNDIQEIAEATFFEDNQKSFFNFLTSEFTVDL